jgi:thymidine kinase
VWMMKCKDCGWNTTHTSKYCEEAKHHGASFSVPATHPYWALSKKAHPSATAAGSATTSTGTNDKS